MSGPGWLRILPVVLCAVAASPATARDTAALLRRGERAERSARYSGVKQIWACCSGPDRHGSDYRRSVRIWHDGPGRTRLELLRAEGGPARVVVENGARRWFFSTRQHAWRPVSWREPEPRLSLLLRNYRLLPGPTERVAGRSALRVRVEPRFAGNPRKCVWLDLTTGITLRTDLYNSAGRLVSRSEFLRFTPEQELASSLFSVPASVSESAPKPGESPNRELASPHLSFQPALPRYLPRGYVLERRVPVRTEGAEMVRALYTDGLNTLSLIEWRGARSPEDRDRERFWGPGDRIRWTMGATHVTLSGDLPAAELHRIAASVRLPGGSSRPLISRK